MPHPISLFAGVDHGCPDGAGQTLVSAIGRSLQKIACRSAYSTGFTSVASVRIECDVRHAWEGFPCCKNNLPFDGKSRLTPGRLGSRIVMTEEDLT